MAKRPSMKTTKKQIVEWGMNNIPEAGYGVDACNMETYCWRCGCERHTERCHVVPHSLGGEDTPSNYRLFCKDCHREQPNVKDYDATDKWVRETNVGTYNMFWKIREIFQSVGDEVSWHWGDTLNSSTKQWMSHEFLKRANAAGIHVDVTNIHNIARMIT